MKEMVKNMTLGASSEAPLFFFQILILKHRCQFSVLLVTHLCYSGPPWINCISSVCKNIRNRDSALYNTFRWDIRRILQEALLDTLSEHEHHSLSQHVNDDRINWVLSLAVSISPIPQPYNKRLPTRPLSCPIVSDSVCNWVFSCKISCIFQLSHLC
jgi:hypothetical protein